MKKKSNVQIIKILPKAVTSEQFAEMVKDFTRSTAVSLTYFVDDSRSRVVKGAKQIQKLVRVKNAYLNHDYAKKVINLTGEVNFKAEQLNGKTRISSTLLQSNRTGEKMLDLKILNTEVVELLGYFHDGKPITEAEATQLDLWTDSYYNPTPKKTAGRGLVSEEDNFHMITPYISRITDIKFCGLPYTIKEHSPTIRIKVATKEMTTTRVKAS